MDLSKYKTVLFEKKYSFKNVYDRDDWEANYTYEVILCVIKDFRGYNSIIHNDTFKEYAKSEKGRCLYRMYDDNINIRDLYPLEIHLKDKRELDIIRFKDLNDYILKINKRISRRVTKREIVYKKDKSLSIITIQICKRGYLKVFLNNKIIEIDNKNKFETIPKSNCKPLEQRMKIYTDEDISYLKNILKEYVKRTLE